jgi:hypothetical protein
MGRLKRLVGLRLLGWESRGICVVVGMGRHDMTLMLVLVCAFRRCQLPVVTQLLPSFVRIPHICPKPQTLLLTALSCVRR